MATKKKQAVKNRPPDYVLNALDHPDQEEAEKEIYEREGLEFDSGEDGSKLALLTQEYEQIKARYHASQIVLEQLETKLNNTPQYVKSPNTENKTTFKDWKTQDKFYVLLLSVCLVLALFMGSANIYANLMSEIAFMENPWLAVILSGLMPAGSTGVKFISNFFEYAKTKKRYALCVYSLTAIFLLAWSAVFAMNFNGSSGGMDWDAIGEGDGGKGAWLVWIQITSELLIAASIFLAIEDITLKYAPDCPKENSERDLILKSIAAHEATHKPLRDAHNAIFQDMKTLSAEREKRCKDRVQEFRKLRKNYDNIHS